MESLVSSRSGILVGNGRTIQRNESGRKLARNLASAKQLAPGPAWGDIPGMK
jgi:hypothetical protein